MTHSASRARATEVSAVPPAPAAPSAPRATRVHRLAWAVGTVLAGTLLFLAYYRQSRTVPLRSDAGSVALQAWDMLHGNVLLSHWHMSDVSFWSTELVQYVLLEAGHGLGPGVVHLGGAMTYTLLLGLAAYLAKGRAQGREALVRVLIVLAIMLAPAAIESPTLLLTPDHLGSAIPVLLAWLAVDRLTAGPADGVTAPVRPALRWALPGLVLVGAGILHVNYNQGTGSATVSIDKQKAEQAAVKVLDEAKVLEASLEKNVQQQTTK